MIEVLEAPVIAYKGFTRGDITCKGFKYTPGETYNMPINKIELCRRGFHACTTLEDTYKYYPQKSSVYYEVILNGLILRDTESEDSKIVASEITIGEEPVVI